MFTRLLIANRGEIALRIIRAARELGIETVCVYSDADAEGPWLEYADRTICIGPGPDAESYLRIDRIISAAEIANVDAIHPGYGFLAENSHFAEVCRDCHIEFIGPSPEAMALLGDKLSCRKMAKESKTPIFPGSTKPIESDDEALKLARKIGYPVIVKAVAGGGGRGMRVAHNDMSLRSGLHSAMAEAEAAFGDAAIYIEKFIERARHVEVQIIGDQHGNVVHLFERDCTMQRRHQKLIEEAPCPVLKDDQRESICRAAVRLCKAAKYYSAGTVEFLYDVKKKKFYLMEVNTRVQVADLMARMAGAGVRRFIATDVARDGMLSSPDFDGLADLVRRGREVGGVRVIASGGVAKLDHLRRLAALGVEGAIVGRAIYEGSVDLAEAVAEPALYRRSPPRDSGQFRRPFRWHSRTPQSHRRHCMRWRIR